MNIEIYPIIYKLGPKDWLPGITIELSNNQWVIRYINECLNKKHQWIYEPSPSQRSPKFLKETRFEDLNEAIEVAQKVILNHPDYKLYLQSKIKSNFNS